MPAALITGVTGQDGGYLAERLSADGWAVTGTVRPGEAVPGHLEGLLGLTLVEVDLLDTAATAQVHERAQPDTVFNLAGISSVAQSWAEPVLTHRVNALAVCELLELAWQQQERTGRSVRFVQASSAEIFARTAQVPQDETTPLCPASPYGASKAAAHHQVHVYRGRGLHAVNVVFYNHESPRRPPQFVTRKITSTAAAIAAGRAHELVLGNLDARRDWGWAPDYVDGMVRAAAHSVPDDYVLATGTSHSVAEFAAAALARVGIADWERYVRSDPAFGRPTDAAELVGDATRAREVLGWSTTVDFTELVGRMVDADRDEPGQPARHGS